MFFCGNQYNNLKIIYLNLALLKFLDSIQMHAKQQIKMKNNYQASIREMLKKKELCLNEI